ncbi:hypothetical protein CDLVIII_1356 [Clostridium sp. DL-VIII]|uniref:hypothetical protein n=1 Tax=Clostridium sp. DL-VIII TaxID=641107 RepID=UPI00023AF84B|nr:hypothetical protein [Clostridium sp. DL-VIII]EHI98055.1 hypothetical protein CDLVIII_1356 [Clostridium sp. DL-VIII]
MSIKDVEIQDDQGNIYYPHTNASLVKYNESTVEEALDAHGTSLSEKANNTDNSRTTTNKTVTGAINELNNNKASNVYEAPTAPTLINGWINYSGYGYLYYWKDSLGYVCIRGVVSSGTPDTPIFTLPAGYRPNIPLIFAADDNCTHSYVYIGVNGMVVGHTNTRLSVNIKFRESV